MHVAMDGVILERPQHGGVARLFQTILPLMCELDADLRVTLYHAHTMHQAAAPHPHITPRALLPLDHASVRIPLLNRDLRRKWALALGAQPQDASVWHSTYFTCPPNWSKPKVVMVYDLIYFLYADLFTTRAAERVRQNILREVQTADVVMCISAATKHDLEVKFGIDPSKMVVTHLAADPAFHHLQSHEARDDLNLPTTKPFLLYVGQRYQYKNFSILLEALSRTQADLDLVVIGPPWTAAEEQELVDKKLTGCVHLLAGVGDRKLNLLYNHAFAFVYPSLYEGFGIPLLEAMACGCPVIASRIPATEEIAQEIPYYFDPRDVDSLLAAINQVEAQGLETGRIANGMQLAAQFSWQKTAAGILTCYYRAAQLPPPDFLAQPDGVAAPLSR